MADELLLRCAAIPDLRIHVLGDVLTAHAAISRPPDWTSMVA